MNRYHILKDGQVIATTCDKAEAIYMIQNYQAKETHYLLRASFSIIYGEEENIPYPKPTKSKKRAG